MASRSEADRASETLGHERAGTARRAAAHGRPGQPLSLSASLIPRNGTTKGMAMKERSVWELARMAECSDPDTDSSPGADFLRSIESSVADALNTINADSGDMDEWQQERASEIADYCVPVYTHNLWV